MGDDFVKKPNSRALWFAEQIKNAETRFEAANLIRAHACHVVSKLNTYTFAQRFAIIERAEERAELLEQNLTSGVVFPWRS